LQSSNDAFATRLMPDASLACSSFPGGSGDDEAYGIAAHSNSNARVARLMQRL
jgi:hypothetical protein